MSSEVQSVLIPRTFTQINAIAWLEAHGYKNKKIDITDDYYRFRQEEPIKFKRFTMQKLPNGVQLIIGWHIR